MGRLESLGKEDRLTLTCIYRVKLTLEIRLAFEIAFYMMFEMLFSLCYNLVWHAASQPVS